MSQSHRHSWQGNVICHLSRNVRCHLVTQASSIRKFIQMSYKHFGNGPSSRNAQVVVNQCVHILYALRCVFLIHCLDRIHDSQVQEPQRLSLLFLNSHEGSNFSSLQDIKRPAKQCIPDHHGQNVEWIGTGHTCLQVHTGPDGLGRVVVSHAIIRAIFDQLMSDIQRRLQEIGVPAYCDPEFDMLRDGLRCTTPGHGMATFNRNSWPAQFVILNPAQDFRLDFITKASGIYRLAMAAIHVSGGASPRGTEEAVTRLLNSQTEAMRNVVIMCGTIGVQNG